MVSDKDDSKKMSRRERGAGKVRSGKTVSDREGGFVKLVKIRETGFDISI